MKIVDRYKLPNDTIYARKKAILDLIYGEDFDIIPTYLKSNDEISSVLSKIDTKILNDIDYATIMLAIELGMTNDFSWTEIGTNWIYPKLTFLSFKLHQLKAINMQSYILHDVAKVIDNVDYAYVEYSIVEIDDISCTIYLNRAFDSDLLLECGVRLGDGLDRLMRILSNEYININVSYDVCKNSLFVLHSIIDDYDHTQIVNNVHYFPIIVRPKDYNYIGEILEIIYKEYPYNVYKERSIYYELFSCKGGLPHFDGYINRMIPFTGYTENHSLLTLNEFIKRDYFFDIHDMYEFMLIGNVLYVPKISERTIMASECLELSTKHRHLMVVINSMKCLLADNVSRDLYINRMGVSNQLIDEIFELVEFEDSVVKSYSEISKIARNPWKAYVRDIKNQFRYNPALFTITIVGFILACSSIIQVLQTANIIKPIS